MSLGVLGFPGRILGGLRKAAEAQIGGLRSALALLLPADRRRFLLLTLGQAILGLLDIVGIVLMGLVAAVLASGLIPGRMPGYVSYVLTLPFLDDLTLIRTAALLGAVAVLAMLAKSAFGVLFTRALYRFLAHQQADVSERLVQQFLSQPLLFVQRWTTARAQYALTSGVGFAIVIALGGASSALAEFMLFTVVALVLLAVDPWLLLLVAVIFGLVTVFLQVNFGRRTSKGAADFTESTMRMNASVADSLATYRETVVLDRRPFFIRRFAHQARINASANAEMQYVLEIPKYLLESVLVVVAFGLAIVQLASKEFPAAAGTVALFLTAGFRVIPSMLRLQAAGTNLRRGVEGAMPTFQLVDELRAESTDLGHGSQAGSPTAGYVPSASPSMREEFRADVVVDQVSFTYPGAARPALTDVSFTATPGMSVALVGSTGAGKSTLADVILGVLAPDRGEVRICGLTPGDAVGRWPGSIAYVPQAVALIDGSVRDNVALGLDLSEVDDDRVWGALTQAHLDAFLRKSRDGLDTVVGERGVRLSGGQRQRLGIARALFTNPRVLVMDEATSALDAETEATITETLQGLEGQVTTITVAHRLATVRFADELLFMRDGAIVARGTFEEVRALEPDFARQARLLGL